MTKTYVRRLATLAAIIRCRKLVMLLVSITIALAIPFSHQVASSLPSSLAIQETLKDHKLSQTVFTYQGQLRDGSLPANGAYDIQFTMHAAQTGGDGLGSIVHEGAVLTKGSLTVRLDFDRVALEANECWLEVAVRRNGSQEGYTVLSPRQKLTPTPYAILAQAE